MGGGARADVGLRDVRGSDLAAFFGFEQDPEALRRSRFTPRAREAFLTHWRTGILGEAGVFAQTVTADGEVAGRAAAWWEGGRRFVGYWLGRAYRGRGVGTAALARFLERERARPLYADPHEENTGSVRLLEKAGFRHAGRVRHGRSTRPRRSPARRGGPSRPCPDRPDGRFLHDGARRDA